MKTAIADAADARPCEASGRAYDPVVLERELREAVKAYGTQCEIELAIQNTKLLSGIAPRAADRALCLMRLVALHDRRRALAL